MSIVYTRMSHVCYSYVTLMCLYFIYMYSYAIRMSLVCTRMSSVCHLYVLACNGMSFVCTRMSSVFHSHLLVSHPYVTRMYSYVIRMSLVCTCMSPICHSYVLVCHLYVTRMYAYVIRMSLVCTRMSSLLTRMWFYHEPFTKEETNTLSETLKKPKIISNKKYKLNNKTTEPPKKENKVECIVKYLKKKTVLEIFSPRPL